MSECKHELVSNMLVGWRCQKCGYSVRTLLDKAESELSKAKAELAAKERQLTAAAEDWHDTVTCDECQNYNNAECNADGSSCIAIMRRRWEERAK